MLYPFINEFYKSNNIDIQSLRTDSNSLNFKIPAQQINFNLRYIHSQRLIRMLFIGLASKIQDYLLNKGLTLVADRIVFNPTNIRTLRCVVSRNA